MTSLLCALCNDWLEDEDHPFVSCRFSRMEAGGSRDAQIHSIEELCGWSITDRFNKDRHKALMGVVYTYCWLIWQFRYGKIFTNPLQNYGSIISSQLRGITFFWFKNRAKCRNFRHNWIGCRPNKNHTIELKKKRREREKRGRERVCAQACNPEQTPKTNTHKHPIQYLIRDLPTNTRSTPKDLEAVERKSTKKARKREKCTKSNRRHLAIAKCSIWRRQVRLKRRPEFDLSVWRRQTSSLAIAR
ncbi:hypothetical protein OSB04_000362 [Centaurea solstitialis]|uniref:Uncharacterized protein n=1 Tax=Centaurea solstitialis TaxID=347529 RepID=A0AA38WUH9_9ASTR|nr:hypothetical protein OSB04_000362 [Centaurea solstitialis]